MAERLKAPVLKTGSGESRSWVRIPPPPPTSLAVAAISGEQREMAAFVARFERPTEPEKDEDRRHSRLCGCFSPRGHRSVRFRDRFGETPPKTPVAYTAYVENGRRLFDGWGNRSIRGRPLASGSSSPTAGRHAG